MGTPADNANDMASKGRSTRGKSNIKNLGTRNGRSKLTVPEVLEIKQSSMSVRKLAAIYGVHYGTIQQIRDGTAWNWV